MKRFRLKFKLNKYSTRNATVYYTSNYGLTWNVVYDIYSTFRGRLAPLEVDINSNRADMEKEKYSSLAEVKKWNLEQRMKYLEQTNQEKAKKLLQKKSSKEGKKELKKRMNSLNS